ncbi:hypothetical protein ACP70R_043007 [Stipagrostis hirtigluma subsp. patula]
MPPQEELLLSLMEPAEPITPPFFLNLPPPPPQHGQGGEDDDLVPPYIFRLLMEEEDTVLNNLLHQYADDHPVLLQAQQPYAQILAEAPSSSYALDPWRPCSSSVELSPLQLAAAAPCYSDNIDTLASDMMSSGGHGDNVGSTVATDAVEPSSMDVVTMAFFKGMEEASKFLPGGTEKVDRRGRKKRLDDDGEVEAAAGMGKRSKQMAAPPMPETEEDVAAREMLDKLMLNGNGEHLTDIDVREPRQDDDAGKEKPPRVMLAVDLHTMLIRCAEAVAANDHRGTTDLLLLIRHHSPAMGDGTQRLAHCFAEGLEARLAGTGSQLYRSLWVNCASVARILKAYQLYMASKCFPSVQFLFSNQIIYKAIAGKNKLHVVQYGLGYGFQWPDLLRRLARRKGGPPMVRLTGIDTPQPGFRPAHLINDTARRLSDCARQFGVPFKFRSIVAKSEDVRAEDLDIDPDEVLVVNTLYHFGTLMDESVIVDRPNPKDIVLNTIRKMRPKVFIHGVGNGSSNTAFFLTRFRDALFHFSALFDITDTVMPWDNDKRLLVEQVYARYAINMIACEGADRVERHQGYKLWQARSKKAGLRQLPLDPDIVQMVKDKMKKENHKFFFVDEDDRWLLKGWKGRVLYALSTWMADDA